LCTSLFLYYPTVWFFAYPVCYHNSLLCHRNQSPVHLPQTCRPLYLFSWLVCCLFTCVPSSLFRFLPLSHITSFVFLLLILRCSAMHKQCMYDVLTLGNLRFDWKYAMCVVIQKLASPASHHLFGIKTKKRKSPCRTATFGRPSAHSHKRSLITHFQRFEGPQASPTSCKDDSF
jgi:hypothetical protein